MRRRQLIGTVGAATTIGIAGCSGGGGGVTGPSTPEETARAYLEAYFAGEYEEARTFAVGTKREEMTKEIVAETAAREPVLNEVINTKQESGNAVVSTVVTAESALGDITQTTDLLLVKQEGGWKVTRSRNDFEGTNRVEAASAFDSIVEGPVDVAFEYIRQKGSGNNTEANQYLTEDYESKLPSYDEPDTELTTLQSVSKSQSSAEVVVRAEDNMSGYNYTHNLVKQEGSWRINAVDSSFVS